MTTKVLVVTNMPSVHNVELLDELGRQAELDLHVLYLTHSTTGRTWTDRPRISHPHTLLAQWPRSAPVYWSRGALRYALHERPDVAIVGQYANLPIQVMVPFLRRRGSRIVAWLEPPGVGYSEAPPSSREAVRTVGRALSTRLLANSTSELWSVSRRGVSAYEACAAWPKTRVVPYFGGLASVEDTPQRELPDAFSMDRPLRLLYAGKMVERKGVDLFGRALATLLATDDIAVEARFVGDGPLSEPTAEMFAREPQVHFISQAERAEMRQHFEWADICVVPSRYDGWGLVAIEAAMARCAIVASSEVASATDALAPRNGCVLVSPTPQDIQYAIDRLYRSPSTIAELAAAGRAAASLLSARRGAAVFASAIYDLMADGPQ